MLKPEYLQSVPAPMVSLYEQVEADIIADMAERIAAMDYYIPAAEWQMKKLEEMGMTRTAVVKRLSQTTGISEKKLKSIMKSTGNATLKSDREVYKRAGLTPGPLAASENLQRVIESGYQKTLKTFKNLTDTTANTATKQFENALDRAWLQINSGAFSPQEAIKNSIQSLTEKGLEAIEYPSGHVDHLDVAVRRAVVTGVNQTSAGLQIELAKELGADLVETTAHGGARPSHAEWQGKVFSLSGESKKYPSLAEGTGYGTVTGLCGANCRHSFFPYFEGSGKAYSEAELEDYKAEKYEYNGHRMTEYQATQKQRKIERYLRRWKREEKAMKAAGLPAEKAHAKVRKWNDIQEDFLEQTGLKRQYDREWVANPKNGIESKLKSGTIKSIDIDDFKAATYGKGIDPEVEDVIYRTIKGAEKEDGFYISETAVKSILEDADGKHVLQIEPLSYGLLQLNINKDAFSGKTLKEADKMFAASRKSVANTLEEAVKHECGHAKLIKGLRTEQIEKLYSELEKIHINDVSDIAYGDGAECIAEVEVLLFRGSDVPQEAFELYKKYIRR